ncbi:hypothetical protein ACFL20_08905 [Spirochaetota bacterium]
MKNVMSSYSKMKSKTLRHTTTNMKRLGVKYGIESMCIGGGMGAAALFELCD